MSKETNLEVALAKELCPCCAKTEMDGPILMNTLLTPKAAKEVKEAHGKVIGFSEKLCENCEKISQDGANQVLVIIVEELSDEEQGIFGVYRTGEIIGLRTEVYKEIFGEENMGKLGFSFIDYQIANKVFANAGFVSSYEPK